MVLRETAQPATFDYSSLDNPTQSALRTHASELAQLTRDTGINLWRMGQRLFEAQRQLASHGNGTFVRWLEAEAGLNYRTAYRLIRVYRTFDFDTLSKTPFPTSALYALSEPSTPDVARLEAIQRATNGEAITHARAREIVEQHMPPRPALPPLPDKPEPPEYREFERNELLPQLHDAGIEDAPQMLSGQEEGLQPVPAERREWAKSSLREAIAEVLRSSVSTDEESIDACADEILGMLGQNNSIAIAARIGSELQKGPRTLSDLVSLALWVCDVRLSTEERREYLAWRKRVLRLIDAITSGGGLPIYEHVLANRQICYSLIEDAPDCP